MIGPGRPGYGSAMGIRVVAVDMDGTFLRPDMTFDADRFNAIRRRMDAAGVRFVVASGNQYWQLSSFIPPDSGVAYVSENGHFVYDHGDDKPSWAAELPTDVAHRMIEVLLDQEHPYLVCAPTGAYAPSTILADHEAMLRQFYYRLDLVEDVRTVADDVVKAALLTPGSDPLLVADRLGAALGGAMTPVVSGPQDIDLNVPGVNKATGLGHLLEQWNIDWADVIAFGDNHNDLEMLQAAGHAVAMGNAREAVLEVADEVAPLNHEDGVLEVLDRLF